MPKHEGNSSTHDVPTAKSKFRTGTQKPHPEQTIHDHQHQRYKVDYIEDFKKSLVLRKEGICGQCGYGGWTYSEEDMGHNMEEDRKNLH